MPPILMVEALTKTYVMGAVSVPVLRSLDLQVEQGEFLTVMGPSGAGKSTLLQLLGGLDAPSSGKITLEGRDITQLSERQLTILRRERTGFVFQYFNLVPTLTVQENVALPNVIQGRMTSAMRDRVDDLLQLFRLEGKGGHRPNELSAGEQQRVAIARAFMAEPAIVFGDEPTGNLDTNNSREIIQLLWESCDNFKQTVLVVTHDPQVAAFGDRVLFMQDGLFVDELRLGRREDHSDVSVITDRLQKLSL